MKVNRSVKALALGVVSSGALLLTGCWGDSSNSSKTTVSPPAVTALSNSYQVLLKDAVTGSLISDTLSVKFTGDAALTAADGTALNGTSVNVSGGLYALGATFSATAKDFSVQVVDASGNGWVSSGTTVTGVSGQTGVSSVVLSLVNTKSAAATNASDAPLAIEVSTGTADASGALTADVSAVTVSKTITLDDGTTTTMPSAAVTLAAGTVAKTASGALAAAGPLTVSSVAFSTSTSAGLAAVPGGSSANASGAPADVLKGADPTAVAFLPAGFAEFAVTDSAGNAITSFDPPVAVSIDIPKSTKNADDTPVTAGTVFPIWSFNQATGSWTYEKSGVVTEKTPVDADNFTIPFTTSHFSAWTAAQISATCSVKVNVPAGFAPLLDVQLVRNGAQFAPAVPLSSTASLAQFLEVPKLSGSVLVSSNKEIIGQKVVADFCAGDVTFASTDLSAPTNAAKYGQVVVNVTEACADGSQSRGVPGAVNIDDDLFGYATVATGATVGSVTFISVPTVAGTSGKSVSVKVQNSRTLAFTSKTATVTDGQTTTVPVNFTMTCATGG